MQQLHLVGFTTDHDALIFSARKNAKSGGFLVALDDELYDTIDEVARLRDGGDPEENGSERGRRSSKKERTPPAPRPESALSPRDIQMRLRAGRSITSVANEAGVNEEWITRFAAPILAEQAQVVSRAQGMTFAKARLGDSGRPLGESVWWNIADKGALMASDTFDQCWSAQHLRDSIWVVRFEFVNRKKRQRAEWELDTRDRTITARNRLASELGYVEPGRRGRPPAPLPPVAKPAPRPAAAAPAAKRSAASKRRVAVKRPATKKKATARKATTKKSTARKSTARKSSAKKAPARKTTARKAPAKKTAARRPAPKKRATVKRAAPKRTAAKRPTAKRAPAKRSATKKSARRPAAKRAPAKKASTRPRRRPQPAPIERFETPELESGEPTGSLTIRAARAGGKPEPELQETAAVPAVQILADEPTPLPAPPAVLSTPSPVATRPAPAPRRFGRLRRRRPPGG